MIIVCSYCQQSHAFLPPPLEPVPPPREGMQAEARVRRASMPRIALLGIGVASALAIVVPLVIAERSVRAVITAAPTATTATGPSDPKAVYTKGQPIDIHWGSSWWPGSIVEQNGVKYRVHYDGYGESHDEWLTAERLRPRASAAPAVAPEADAGDPNTSYAVGDAVDIRWGGSWYPGSVKQKNSQKYWVHYDGYSASWDEWVTAIRLRPRSGGAR